MNWRPIDGPEKPERRRPIIMRGSSGYIKPNDVAYVTGYYDDEYRPRMPWLDFSGDAVTDGVPMPTHWIYRDELEAHVLAPKTPVDEAIAREHPGIRTKL